jgi:hypothetical protein
MRVCERLDSAGAIGLVTALVLVTLALSESSAHARRINHRSENEWTSTQKASLGNIAALSENFTDQFFSDPSLQARKKSDFDLQVMSINAYASDDLVRTTNDAQDFLKKLQNTETSSGGLDKGLDALEFIASLTGRRPEAGATVQLFALRIGRFSLLPYVNIFTKAHIDVPSWPQAEVMLDQYSALGMGYSHPLGKSFDLGINLRPGLRAFVSKEISASSLDIETESSSGNDPAEEGFKPRLAIYVPLDLGVGYQMTNKVRTHLSMRNVYGASVSNLSSKADDGRLPAAPPDLPFRVATGMTWGLFEDKVHRVRIASELQDVASIAGLDDFWMRWQWAAQYLYTLSFRKQTSFGFNAGLQSGYPSVGVLLDLFLFKVEAAYAVFEGGGAVGQDPVPVKSLRVFSEISF